LTYLIFLSILNRDEVDMKQSWKTLLSFTGGKKFVVKEIFIPEDGITIKGEFEVPPLAILSMEDYLFVAAFIQTHGSIKQMESIFNISYPTVKSRLHKIAQQLDVIDVEIETRSPLSEILDRLESGDISGEDALKEMM
jgi:hypothetical protein